MSEQAEFIGSMPSTPEQKPQPPISQQKTNTGNPGSLIGFFLWAICILVFPTYARMDDLGKGVFYGIGVLLLLIVFVGLVQMLARPLKRNRLPKAPEIKAEGRKSQRIRRLNGILGGIVLLLLAVYFLTLSSTTGLGTLAPVIGLILLPTGIIVTFMAIRRSYDSLSIGGGEALLEADALKRRQRSNSIWGCISFLFLGMLLLFFPQMVNMNTFSRGFFYGMGLLVLLFALVGLCNVIFRHETSIASSGK